VLGAHEAARGAAAAARVMTAADDVSRPLARTPRSSRPTGSITTATRTRAAISKVFGDASDALFAYLGIDAAYLATASYFTVESHLSHLREALFDDRIAPSGPAARSGSRGARPRRR